MLLQLNCSYGTVALPVPMSVLCHRHCCWYFLSLHILLSCSACFVSLSRPVPVKLKCHEWRNRPRPKTEWRNLLDVCQGFGLLSIGIGLGFKVRTCSRRIGLETVGLEEQSITSKTVRTLHVLHTRFVIRSKPLTQQLHNYSNYNSK